MSNGSDPQAIINALDQAQDAFGETIGGIPRYEEGIESGADWQTQLTKACKLIEVATLLQEQNGYYTAVIEVCFGAIERSIEAYVVAMAGDEARDFQDHEFSYQRAHEVGLFEEETATDMMDLYSENRTESYYGGSRPSDRQAEAMTDLVQEVHNFVVDQIRVGGVCICE